MLRYYRVKYAGLEPQLPQFYSANRARDMETWTAIIYPSASEDESDSSGSSGSDDESPQPEPGPEPLPGTPLELEPEPEQEVGREMEPEPEPELTPTAPPIWAEASVVAINDQARQYPR